MLTEMCIGGIAVTVNVHHRLFFSLFKLLFEFQFKKGLRDSRYLWEALVVIYSFLKSHGVTYIFFSLFPQC